MRTSVLYHENMCLTRGDWDDPRKFTGTVGPRGGTPGAAVFGLQRRRLAGCAQRPGASGAPVALRRIGFRGAEEYDMPIDPMKEVTPDNREPWVRLTNGVAVCLRDGFVCRGVGKAYACESSVRSDGKGIVVCSGGAGDRLTWRTGVA